MTTEPRKVCVRVTRMRGLRGLASTSGRALWVLNLPVFEGTANLVSYLRQMGLHFWLLLCSCEHRFFFFFFK